MNENMNGNKKLFWKEVNNTKGGNVENCSRIKDVIGGCNRIILKICII